MNTSNQEEIPLGTAKERDDGDEEMYSSPVRFRREEFQSLPQAQPALPNGQHSLLQSITRPFSQSLPRRYIYAAAVIALMIIGWLFYPGKPPPPPYKSTLPNTSNFTSPGFSAYKPEGLKIVGLVFYGRRDRSSILECYLRNNLASNGGWLDEVAWGVNTNNAEDIAYLDEIIASNPGYRKIEIKEKRYYELWRTSVEKGNIYVKIDDDVVFMKDDTIPLMVDALLTNPEAMIISSNTVNNAKLSWLHYRTGAILPYLPEIEDNHNEISSATNPVWRPSELPNWTQPIGFKVPGKIEDFYAYFRKLMGRNGVDENTDFLAPHRWLPVTGPGAINKTPIIHTEFRTGGKGLFNWIIAAQQHYSFFDHLENGHEYMYHLLHGSGSSTDGLWDQTQERLSINLIALRGELILDHLKEMSARNDDEAFLTVELPAKINKRIYVQTRALAAHYSFNRQNGLDSTDILARYRAYAVQNICPGTFLHPA